MAKTSYRRRERRPGDRKDGRLLRSVNPFFKFIPFIMINRNDATNYFTERADIGEADKWLRQQRVNGYKGIGFLHVIIAAFIRIVSQFPALNRFVSGRRVYARNEIEIVLTVKKEMRADADESTIKVKFDPADTIYDVYHKMNKAIADCKSFEDTGTDEFAAKFANLPRFIIRFAIWIIKIMDYFGLVPQEWIDVSPFHGSMIITDLGSLGIKPTYHHIYNFGNLPVFIAFGSKQKEYYVDKHGTVNQRKYIDIKMSTDERICDGYYFASALKYFMKYIEHPELLAVPPETVVEDVL